MAFGYQDGELFVIGLGSEALKRGSLVVPMPHGTRVQLDVALALRGVSDDAVPACRARGVFKLPALTASPYVGRTSRPCFGAGCCSASVVCGSATGLGLSRILVPAWLSGDTETPGPVLYDCASCIRDTFLLQFA